MKVKKALALISEKFKEPQKCESCGEDFTCGASLKGCWCFNKSLTDETRENLKSKFTDCLCENCLDKAIHSII
jgi:hypothetical protein